MKSNSPGFTQFMMASWDSDIMLAPKQGHSQFTEIIDVRLSNSCGTIKILRSGFFSSGS